MRAGRLVITLILAGALFGGCAAATAGQLSPPRDAVAIGCDELAAPARAAAATTVERTVTTSVGETFRITLCANPSTGFAWEEPVLSGPAAVELVDRALVPSTSALVGGAGSETFTFRASAPGTAAIHFAYSQPWAGGVAGAWTVNLTVVAS
jgi:predicted secreted protein